MIKKHIISAPAHGAAYNYYSNGAPKILDLQPGKESPDGRIEEGVYIRRLWENILYKEGFIDPLPHTDTLHVLSTGQIESSIKERVWALNMLSDDLGRDDTVAILLHLNAAPGAGWSDATGHSIFHNGRLGAGVVAEEIGKYLRTDENPLSTKTRICEKNLNLGMLRGLKCAAVIVELDFMTNKSVVEKLIELDDSFCHAEFIHKMLCNIRNGGQS